MLVLPLKVHTSVVAKFKRRCKEVYPKECLGYLLGNEQFGYLEVLNIWVPDDIEKHTNSESIYIQAAWALEVLEYCEEHELTPLGTIHSHPYTYEEIKSRRFPPDHSTSEADSLSGITNKVHGICRILQSQKGRLTATVRFWGPEIPVKALYV